MKKLRKILLVMSIIGFFMVSYFLPINTSKAETINYENDGWNISVKWDYNQWPYEINATYTVTEDSINSDGTIDIDCSNISKVLGYACSTAGMTYSEGPKLNLTIKNESGREIKFNDYDFSTIGYQKVGETYTEKTDMSIEYNYGNGWGELLQTYFPFLNEETFSITNFESGICPTVDTIGFDGNKIRMGFIPMRTQSKAMIALFGGDAKKLTVTNIQNIDDLVKEEINTTDYYGKTLSLPADSTRTYGQFVKAYYGVSDFSELTNKQLTEYFDAEDQIEGYDSVYVGFGKGYKYLKFDDINSSVNDYFKKWGYASRSYYNGQFCYGAYFVRESDPELQQLAYEYVYNDVIRFTFDSTKNPVSNNINTDPDGGNVALMNYINKTSSATEMVKEAFDADTAIPNGGSINLANIQVGLISLDAFDQNNMFDFGFSLQYKAEKLPNLTIKVTDEETKEEISDVIYKIQKYNETTKTWEDVEEYSNLVTDENGTINVTEIEKGKYRVVEVDIPDDYISITNSKEFEITDEDEEVLFELRKEKKDEKTDDDSKSEEEPTNDNSNIVDDDNNEDNNINNETNSSIINSIKTGDTLFTNILIGGIAIVSVIIIVRKKIKKHYMGKHF